jgi:hypothetical protein
VTAQSYSGRHSAQGELRAIECGEGQSNDVAARSPVIDSADKTAPRQIGLNAERPFRGDCSTKLFKNDSTGCDLDASPLVSLVQESGSNQVTVEKARTVRHERKRSPWSCRRR